MIVDLDEIFEMESKLKVVSTETTQQAEQKKEMEVSIQEADTSWQVPPPDVQSIPA